MEGRTVKEGKFKLLTGIVSGVVYFVLFMAIDMTILFPHYRRLIKEGHLHQDSILGGEKVYWITMVIIILSIGYLISWLYSKLADKTIIDWKTDIKISLLIFVVGTLVSVYNVAGYFTFVPIILPIAWTLEAIIGVFGAAMTSAVMFCHRNKKANGNKSV
jgi:MFS family permease